MSWKPKGIRTKRNSQETQRPQNLIKSRNFQYWQLSVLDKFLVCYKNTCVKFATWNFIEIGNSPQNPHVFDNHSSLKVPFESTVQIVLLFYISMVFHLHKDLIESNLMHQKLYKLWKLKSDYLSSHINNCSIAFLSANPFLNIIKNLTKLTYAATSWGDLENSTIYSFKIDF